MRRHCLAVLIAALGLSSLAIAQDNTCSVLLQHGIYDTYRQQSGAVNSSQFHNNVCEAYNQYKHDQTSGSVKVSYAVFGAGGDYSASQLDVIGRSMCTTTDSSAFSQHDLSVFSSTINQQAVMAFTECMTQYGYGLRTKTDIRESDAGHVDLSINYIAMPGAPPTLPLNYVTVSPEGSWQCSGELWNKRTGGTTLDSSVHLLVCERVFAATTIDGRAYKAGASTITVGTGNSTVTRHFAPEPTSAVPPPGTFPIGAVVPFWGTKAQADALKGLGWWPCDGTTVSDQLSPLFNTKAPDLTDAFLRGSTIKAGESGGLAKVTIPDQAVESIYNGWSNGNGPEMWVLSGTMGFKTGSLQKVKGTVKGADVQTIPPYRTVIYIMRIR